MACACLLRSQCVFRDECESALDYLTRSSLAVFAALTARIRFRSFIDMEFSYTTSLPALLTTRHLIKREVNYVIGMDRFAPIICTTVGLAYIFLNRQSSICSSHEFKQAITSSTARHTPKDKQVPRPPTTPG